MKNTESKSVVRNQKVFVHPHFVILHPHEHVFPRVLSHRAFYFVIMPIFYTIERHPQTNLNFVKTVNPHLASFVLDSFDFEV